MSVKNKVEVRIAGKDYTLVGIESEEYLQRVALYIDKKMHEVMRSNNMLSTSMAAVLSAVNVADDFFKSRESEIQNKKELEKLRDEMDKLKQENCRLQELNQNLSESNTSLQLELVKREAELSEVRNSFDKAVRVID